MRETNSSAAPRAAPSPAKSTTTQGAKGEATSEAQDKPFGSIAISLSGGGLRAMGYHLGTLSYLHHLGVLEDVTILSSVSGGSFTGIKYALSQKEGKTFEQFYDEVCTAGQKVNLIVETLKKINEPEWQSGFLVFVAMLTTGVALFDFYDDVLERQWHDFLPFSVPFALTILMLVALLLVRRKVWQTLTQMPMDNTWDLVKSLRVSEIESMLKLRMSSLFALSNDIFLNRIRYMGYSLLYSQPQLMGKVLAHDINTLLMRDAILPSWNLPLPSRQMIEVVVPRAARMGTILWFDDPGSDPAQPARESDRVRSADPVLQPLALHALALPQRCRRPLQESSRELGVRASLRRLGAVGAQRVRTRGRVPGAYRWCAPMTSALMMSAPMTAPMTTRISVTKSMIAKMCHARSLWLLD